MKLGLEETATLQPLIKLLSPQVTGGPLLVHAEPVPTFLEIVEFDWTVGFSPRGDELKIAPAEERVISGNSRKIKVARLPAPLPRLAVRISMR